MISFSEGCVTFVFHEKLLNMDQTEVRQSLKLGAFLNLVFKEHPEDVLLSNSVERENELYGSSDDLNDNLVVVFCSVVLFCFVFLPFHFSSQQIVLMFWVCLLWVFLFV